MSRKFVNDMDNFESGALLAIAMIVELYDEPVIAKEVLLALGLENAKYNHLESADRKNLDKIKAEISPLGKKSPILTVG